MEPIKILHIINQKAGAITNADIADLIKRIMDEEENPSDYRIYYLGAEKDAENIKEQIASYRPDVVAAAGGDGTVNFVARTILGMPLKMGIVPLGSANGLAFELGIPQKIEDALKLIISGRSRPMDVIQINDEHLSLHLSDIGLNAKMIKEFEKEGIRGFKGYVKQFFEALKRPPESFKCIIRTDDYIYTHKAYMILIANASYYRSGANMNPTGYIDDGRFEIVVFRPYDKWFWRSISGAFLGNLHRKPNIKTYDCTSAQIEINPPEELQVDGEHLGKSKMVSAKILKHALEIILP